ncbi:MAG: ABC transporter permease [Burkholderiales bacterium]|nr:ABC transporter permease [Burkholderiales bacterium]
MTDAAACAPSARERMVDALRPALESALLSAGALAVAAVLVIALVLLVGHDPREIATTLARSAFGSRFAWENTLSRAAPLMLAALCTAIPAHAGLVVIGGEGALVLGGLAASQAALFVADVPPFAAIAITCAAGMLVGAAWIGLVGALQQARGVNEVISSLLLSIIALGLFDWLLEEFLRDPASLNYPATRPIPDAARIGALPGLDVHAGLAVALVACVAAWWVLRRSVTGFAIRVVGGGVRAALGVGLPVGRLVVATCVAGGACVGLAGAIEVAAVHERAGGALHADYGNTGILVAFLARHHPLAIVPAALLVGGLAAASGPLQRGFDLPDAFVRIVEGVVFLAVIASETLRGRLLPPAAR